MTRNREAIIIGAGLVGSLWAVYLAKAGYKVTIFERRPDIRKAEISAGKSINLALSVRGWTALDAVGVGDEIRKIAIPMHGRMMHDLNGKLTYQQYGEDNNSSVILHVHIYQKYIQIKHGYELIYLVCI